MEEKSTEERILAGIKDDGDMPPHWPWKIHVKELYEVSGHAKFHDASAEEALDSIKEH